MTVDFITKFPLVAKKDMILVFYDRLSKMTHFIATMEEMLVKGLAQLFKDNVWKLHGLLESMVLDRGPQFVVELTKKLNRMLGIEIDIIPFSNRWSDGKNEIGIGIVLIVLH